MLAVLVYGNGMAALILDILQILQIGMRVAVKHQVYACRLRDDAVAGKFGNLEA